MPDATHRDFLAIPDFSRDELRGLFACLPLTADAAKKQINIA